jgi:hypothetical protein
MPLARPAARCMASFSVGVLERNARASLDERASRAVPDARRILRGNVYRALIYNGRGE